MGKRYAVSFNFVVSSKRELNEEEMKIKALAAMKRILRSANPYEEITLETFDAWEEEE